LSRLWLCGQPRPSSVKPGDTRRRGETCAGTATWAPLPNPGAQPSPASMRRSTCGTPLRLVERQRLDVAIHLRVEGQGAIQLHAVASVPASAASCARARRRACSMAGLASFSLSAVKPSRSTRAISSWIPCSGARDSARVDGESRERRVGLEGARESCCRCRSSIHPSRGCACQRRSPGRLRGGGGDQRRGVVGGVVALAGSAGARRRTRRLVGRFDLERGGRHVVRPAAATRVYRRRSSNRRRGRRGGAHRGGVRNPPRIAISAWSAP